MDCSQALYYSPPFPMHIRKALFTYSLRKPLPLSWSLAARDSASSFTRTTLFFTTWDSFCCFVRSMTRCNAMGAYLLSARLRRSLGLSAHEAVSWSDTHDQEGNVATFSTRMSNFPSLHTPSLGSLRLTLYMLKQCLEACQVGHRKATPERSRLGV